MKLRDSLRLANLALRARRKTTIQTIAGISFGLVLLFPMLYIALAFYGGFSAEINAETNIRRMRVDYGSTNTAFGRVFCNEEYQKNIDASPGITHKVRYEYRYIRNLNDANRTAYFSIDDGPITYFGGDHFNSYTRPSQIGVQIIDADCAHDPFLDSDYVATAKPILAGTTFSPSDSRGEIMVSSKFVQDFDLDIDSIVGSKLTVYSHTIQTALSYSDSADTINQPESFKNAGYVPLWKGFRVVGVYNSALYKKTSVHYSSMDFSMTSDTVSRVLGRAYFWITTASTDAGGTHEAPKRISKINKTAIGEINQTWFYYEDEPKALAEKTTDSGYAFLPMGLGVYSRAIFYPTFTKTEFMEFSSFQTAKECYDIINDSYHRSTTKDSLNPIYFYPDNVAPKRFFIYYAFYDRFFFLCLGFGLFGGIIFVVAMLNLASTLHFSVHSMKEFLGICRAQGMKRRGVTSIFFGQFAIVFGWAYLFMAALGGAACVGIKLLFDSVMSAQIEEDTKMLLTLRLGYMPVAFGIIVAMTMAISLLMSYFLVRKINRTPVLEILFKDGRM